MKFKNTLLSFILPRKMYKHHNMKFVFAFGLFLVSILIVLFSVNLKAEKFMKKQVPHEMFYENKYENPTPLSIPKYTLQNSKENVTYLDVDAIGMVPEVVDSYRDVFHQTIKKKESDGVLDLTIVFVEDLDSLKESETEALVEYEKLAKIFDLNGYINQQFNKDNTYVLYIYTKKAWYYCYNLGKTLDKNGEIIDDGRTFKGLSFITDKDTRNDIYYLPNLDKEELKLNSFGDYDVSLWTREVQKGETVTIGDKTITSARKLTKNIRFAFQTEYVYQNVSNTNVEKINSTTDSINFSTNSNIFACLNQMTDLMAEVDANIQRSIYALIVVLTNVFLPLIWVFITWLISKSFVMRKFREYYAICSIAYIDVSIIGLILGFFISFDKLILILLILELIFYIFITFRINSDNSLLEKEKENKFIENNQTVLEKPSLKFKHIDSNDLN